MNRFIIFLAAVCFGCLPGLCRGQTEKPNDVQAGEDPAANQHQRFVDGYGPALQFLAKELSPQAQADDLLVVWLFDESASMRDDQKEIDTNLAKMHAQIQNHLRLFAPNRNQEHTVKYCVYSFGSTTHAILEAPSSELGAVRAAMKRIPVEESGAENTVFAVGAVIGKTAKLAAKSGRRPVLILVTDESGDDGDNDELLEAAVSRVQQANSPVYVLGREATFGHPYGRIRWIDPKFQLVHWLRIRRGPESAMIESLQWNGLSAGNDVQSVQRAGCGPYVLVRLAKASGGACLMLPFAEEMLLPAGAVKRNHALLPEQYRPSHESRLSYLMTVVQSPFRSTLQEIVGQFDPSSNSQLSIRESGYPVDEAEFKKEAEKQRAKIQHAHRLLEKSIARLEEIRQLREQETSARWQAHYDLTSAQLAVYRIRLQQTALAMDRLTVTIRSLNSDKNHCWNLFRVRKKPIIPDEAQFARLKTLLNLTMTRDEYLDQLDDDVETARQRLQDVIDRHPNTPWAHHARYQLNLGFGMMFRHVQRPPALDLKIPLPHL